MIGTTIHPLGTTYCGGLDSFLKRRENAARILY